MERDADSRTIESVGTACEIIRHLKKPGVDSVSELADELDRSVGTVHTHLATLKRYGYVVQSDRRYELGPQFLPDGEYVRNHSDLYGAAKQQIDELADVTGEAAHLIIEHHGKLYAMYERFGDTAVGVEYHNKKREKPLDHLHCTAAGKAILAHLSEERLYEIIDRRGLSRNTPNTVTEAETLIEELETIRERGVSFADEEQMEGIRAVGAPVQGPDRGVVGAIALSGPTSRLKNERFREEFPEKVVHAANVTELNLQTEQFGDAVE